MARRAVVMDPPPGDKPRRAVLLRAGPRQRDRRTWIDVALGVGGVLLLVLTVLLFSLLPQDPPVIPQFEVSFEETVIEADPQTADFAEGDANTFTFPYDGDNLYHVGVAFTWADDVASSLPDTFRIEVVAPNGTTVAGPVEHTNLQPDVDSDATPPSYEARPLRQSVQVALAPRPSTHVVAGEAPTDTVDDVRPGVEAEYGRGGGGEWQVVVTLVDAGDCPDPSGFDLSRFTTCQTATGGEGDPGNPFEVSLVTFTKYDAIVRPL